MWYLNNLVLWLQKLSNKENGQASSVPMDENGHLNQQNTVDIAPIVNNIRKVSIVPLVFLIFHEVSGGPFGMEDSVQAASPLLAILGFVIFSFLWSTMFPENGGYVVWVSSAFGPYWDFQLGWMKWLSGVIDNALYLVLFLDYLKSVMPTFQGGLPPRTFAIFGFTVVLTYMNYRGLAIVGWVAVFLGVFSILPFIIMGLMAIPKLRPKRWSVVDLHTVNWSLYLNTLFWNLNYWDSITTLAGEVDDPKKSLPKSLHYAAILVINSYLYPLLIGTGAVPLDRELWTDGYFSDITKILSGVWLTWWMQGAAVSSNMGMFLTKMSSYSYQLLGMAEWGMLPEFFSRRSQHGTRLIAILFSASGIILLSWLSFQEIIAAENILYCFGMLLEFLAFMRLRMKCLRAPRPYKIPLGIIGSIWVIIPPILLIFVELAFASPKIMIVSLVATIAGLVLQPCLKHLKKKQWLRFFISPDFPDFVETMCKNAVETLMDQLDLVS